MGLSMGTGLAISAGAGLLGGLFQSNAASDAASAQQAGVAQGQALQYAMYSRTRQDLLSAGQRADDLLKYGEKKATAMLQQGAEQSAGQYAPYAQVGLAGFMDYAQMLADPSKYRESPAFQWNMEQGLQGINRGRAAAGMLDNGGAGHDYATFAQGLASNDYYNQLGQYQQLGQVGYNAAGSISNITGNYYTNLANLATGTASSRASAGLQGAGSQATLGQSYATNATNLAMAGGQAQAQNAIAQGNIWSNALTSVGQLPLMYSMMGAMGNSNAGASIYGGGMGAGAGGTGATGWGVW